MKMATGAGAASSVIPRWLLESNLTDLDEDDVAALIKEVNSGGGRDGGNAVRLELSRI